MTDEQLRALARDCFSAFAVRPPEAASRAWPVWSELCAQVALESVPFIRANLIARESLPRNFGAAVLALWQEWRAGRTLCRNARSCCPDCDRCVPGFFFAWKKDPAGRLYCVLIRCLCNGDDGLTGKSKAEARQQGYVVMDGGSHSPAGFEAACFAAGARSAGSSLSCAAGRRPDRSALQAACRPSPGNPAGPPS